MTRRYAVRRCRLALASSLVWVGAACGEAGDPSGTGLPEWRVGEPALLTIGEAMGAEEASFDRIAGVRLLEDGRVAIADGGSSTVRVFGPEGAHELTLGGEGDGPGEFRYLNHIRYHPPDALVAYDSEHGRLTRLSLSESGEPESVVFRARDGRPEIYLGPLASGGHAIAWIRQTDRPRDEITPDVIGIATYDETGEQVAVLGEGLGMRRLGFGPLPFSGHFLGATLGDRVLHTDGYGDVVHLLDRDGSRSGSWSHGMSAPDAAAASAALTAAVDPSSLDRLDDVLTLPGADSVPAVSDLLLDDGGRIWLKRYEASTDSHALLRPRTGGVWHVLDPDGQAIATVAVTAGFRVMDVRGDRVAGVARDDLGVERVEVRALVR